MNVHFEIEFSSKIVGRQLFDEAVTPEVFGSKIAPCRTFCEKYQIEYLKSLGLIKGGSLDIAVVLDGDTILNPDGFRVKNECVNHKVLDLIGEPDEEVQMVTNGVKHLGWTVLYHYFPDNEIINGNYDCATSDEFWYFNPVPMNDTEISYLNQNGFKVTSYGEMQISKYLFELYPNSYDLYN